MAVYMIFKYGKRFRCAPSFDKLNQHWIFSSDGMGNMYNPDFIFKSEMPLRMFGFGGNFQELY